MALSAHKDDLLEAVETLEALAADVRERLREARYEIVYVEKWPGRSPEGSPGDSTRRDILGALLGGSLRET